MAYYDPIAKNWHQATGYWGGAFKKYVLNDFLLKKISAVSHKSILELGAGNGYFMRLALHHFSGQIPKRVTITDNANKLLAIAQTHLNVPSHIVPEYCSCDRRAVKG